MFTSGSSGEPKGCVIEHRSYCTSAMANGPVIGLDRESRSLQFSSYSFAGAVVEMLMTLMHGGCVCVVAEEDRGTRFYKTGDLGVKASDESTEILGRRDTQVKLRGQRIEIGEIEHQARQAAPDIINVAVEMTELQGKGPGLIGFFVPRARPDMGATDAQTRTTIQTIRTRLEKVLPHYMVPSALIPIPSLPLKASGKVDRRRLREMGSALSAQQPTELPVAEELLRQPKTTDERRLRDLWAQVLKIEADAIGVHDSFFRLGGNSIAVMKLVAAARRAGTTIAVADVFQNPVLEAQARALTSVCKTPGREGLQSQAS
ncbi:AMP-binding enzyme [Hirsutella rhossiliensis]|uniref:AMP-binding enzyme domain-containing protein n=1 Tax=Hirsutella rhossiliensis TaxID=111463 RepID=A0A9P8MW25_9HYPO|nr:AMP-binding enzyme domain-containing protein [Hirsutella rhossiliensis]KAH0962320.1 AMP-binding enzyme domain-containing protein [Hirsutella rhossiliensis]